MNLDAGLNAPDGGDSPYYNLPKGATLLHDVIRDKEMTWNQANIFKAAYRWDNKPDLMYNLRKIQWFVEDEIKHQLKIQEKQNDNSTNDDLRDSDEGAGRTDETGWYAACTCCDCAAKRSEANRCPGVVFPFRTGPCIGGERFSK